MKNRAIIFKQLLVGTIFLILFGCQKSIIENQADPLSGTGKQGSVSANLNTDPDIYIAGTIGMSQAVYWKNGQAVNLPGGTGASGIAVVGTDVYVCGNNLDANGVYVALYWKNGVLTTLSDGTEDVITTGIAVSGTDVYISGFSGRYVKTALYWKNGVRHTLGAGFGGPVFVATNGDVYIPNWESPSYWKNGTVVSLPGGSTFSGVHAVTVQGSNVYAVGYSSPGVPEIPLYWINGVQQSLMHPDQFTDATDIAVSSTGEAFIAGTTGDDWSNVQVGYWNTFGDLSIWGTHSSTTYPMIAIDDSDIYISGAESNYPAHLSRAMYWKNNNPVYLTDGTSESFARDILVIH